MIDYVIIYVVMCVDLINNVMKFFFTVYEICLKKLSFFDIMSLIFNCVIVIL